MTNISTIVFKNREDLDILRYDNLVEHSKETNIYCLSWYLDTISDNWGCLIKGDYEAVLPIPYTLKMGQKIIYQPFFSREVNFFYNGDFDEGLVSDMIEAIPRQFKKVDFAISSSFLLEGFRKEKVVFQRLFLNDDYTTIRGHYSKNTKRLVNKATRFKLSIRTSSNAAEFVTFFKEYTGNQVDYTDQNYQTLEQLVHYLIEHQKGELLQVVENKKIIAQGVFIYQNKRVTYLKGSVDKRGKELGAMFLLMDYVINSSLEKGVEWLDFGGSNIKSIATFYKKFAAEDMVYYRYSKNDLPWILKKGKMIRDFVKK